MNGEPLLRDSQNDDMEAVLKAMSEQASHLQLVPAETTETPPRKCLWSYFRVYLLTCTSYLVPQNDNPKAEVPDLTGQIVKLGNFAVAGGGFADVWKCEWKSDITKYTVSICILRPIYIVRVTDQ